MSDYDEPMNAAEKIPYKCTVESTAPGKFNKILEHDSISYDDLLKSLDVIKNRNKVF